MDCASPHRNLVDVRVGPSLQESESVESITLHLPDGFAAVLRTVCLTLVQ